LTPLKKVAHLKFLAPLSLFPHSLELSQPISLKEQQKNTGFIIEVPFIRALPTNFLPNGIR
jgi:hypothetical protein